MRGRAVVDVATLRLRERNGPSLPIRDVRPLSYGISDVAHRRKAAVRKKGPRKFWKGRIVTILTPRKPIRPHARRCRTVLRTGLEGEAPGHFLPRPQAPEFLSSGNRRLRYGQPDTKSASALLSSLRNSYAIEPRRTLFSGYNYKDLRMSTVRCHYCPAVANSHRN